MSTVELDFTDVEERDGAVRVEPGNYMLRIADAQDEDANGQPLLSKAGNRKWVLKLEFLQGPAAGRKLTSHLSLTPQALWKIRELLAACGYKVPRGKLKVDPIKLVGRTLGAAIQDGDPFVGNDGKERVSSELAFFLKPGWDQGPQATTSAVEDTTTDVTETVTTTDPDAPVEDAALDEVDLDDLG